MTCASSIPEELAALRAELEMERLARARAEAKLEGFREAVALFAAARPEAASAQPCHACHAPMSRAVTRDSVTASVTPDDRAERNRALARERKQAERLRKRSVTARRDSVTASVTQEEERKERRSNTLLPPSPPPPAAAGGAVRGTLALVTVDARDGQRDRRREHRTPDTLPPEVQALRGAWNELVSPHGFLAWGERTSAKLLRDAQDALARRPLPEWRKVFSLVPRSPLCRGELRRSRRIDLLWLLSGRTHDGHEPADKLLTGTWSLDPESPSEPPPANEAHAPPVAAEVAALPQDTPAARSWREQLEALLAEGGREYALSVLVRLRARDVAEGELVLDAPDLFFANWVEHHFLELLRRQAAIQGFSGVRVTAPAEEGAP